MKPTSMAMILFSLTLLLVAAAAATPTLHPTSAAPTYPHATPMAPPPTPSPQPTAAAKQEMPHRPTTTTYSPATPLAPPPSPKPTAAANQESPHRPTTTAPPPPSPSPKPTAAANQETRLRPTTAEGPSPQPSAAAANQDTHLRNILDALVGSGDYGGWANLLSSANPSDLPLTATLFVPSNDAISAPLDPLLVAYHIVPQRLTFSQLRHLTPTRLPTLLPSNSILLTGNSPDNFTVDGSHITQPDIFLNSAFAVHGLDRLLNYSVYGGSSPLSLAPESGNDDDDGASLQRRPRPRQPKPRRSPPPPGSGGDWVPDIPDVTAPGPKAGAWRPCGGIPAVVISCFFVFFGFMVR